VNVTAISPASIRRDLACLSSMFGCAIDWEWIDVNPVSAYLRRRRKRGALRESPPRTRYLSHAEETALLAAAAPHVAAAIAFAIDTGLRTEEQFSLEWPLITSTRVRVPIGVAKNGRGREVPLLDRSAQISARLTRHIRSSFVFFNPETGTRYRNLDKGFRAACRRAGLKDVRWHDLRRTCGCRLLQDRGFSMEQVGAWLGHSSVKVTEKTYAFLGIEDLERKLEGSAQKPAHRAAHGRRKAAEKQGGEK
jgi:integrase